MRYTLNNAILQLDRLYMESLISIEDYSMALRILIKSSRIRKAKAS